MSEIIRPPQEMARWVKNKLFDLGVKEIYQYPDDMIEAILGTGLSWFSTSVGAEAFNKIFAMKKEEGKENHSYHILDGFGNKREVKHDDVVWFYALFVKGIPTSPEQLVSAKKPTLYCDECGMGGHCPIEIKNPVSGKSNYVCNYCLSNNDSPRIRELGSKSRCETCPAQDCDYWQKSRILRRVS